MFYVYVHHVKDTGDPFYVEVREGVRKDNLREPGVRVSLFSEVVDEEAAIMWEQCLILAYRNAGYFLLNKDGKGLEYRLNTRAKREATLNARLCTKRG